MRDRISKEDFRYAIDVPRPPFALGGICALVCSVERDGGANAAHIVRCVNSHAALVEALEKLLSASYEDGDTLIAARNDARAALRLARGEGEV